MPQCDICGNHGSVRLKKIDSGQQVCADCLREMRRSGNKMAETDFEKPAGILAGTFWGLVIFGVATFVGLDLVGHIVLGPLFSSWYSLAGITLVILGLIAYLKQPRYLKRLAFLGVGITWAARHGFAVGLVIVGLIVLRVLSLGWYFSSPKSATFAVLIFALGGITLVIVGLIPYLKQPRYLRGETRVGLAVDKDGPLLTQYSENATTPAASTKTPKPEHREKHSLVGITLKPRNYRQRQVIILWIGILIIIGMCLFPPWTNYHPSSSWSGRGSTGAYIESIGYHLIFWPPKGNCRVDINRLAIQCIAVALLSGAGIYTLRLRGK